jgi:hypothetical protein
MLRENLSRWTVYATSAGVSIKGVAEKGSESMARQTEATVSLLQFPVALAQIEITVSDVTTVVAFGFLCWRFYWDAKDRRAAKRAKGEV